MKTFQMTGRIGSDAQITELEKKSVIEFSMAENFTYLDAKGKKIEEVVWHDCKIWRNKAKTKVADFLKKGSLVSIEGNLRYNSYEKDGQKISRAYILVSDLQIH